MEAQILMKAPRELDFKCIQNIIIGCTEGLCNLQIFFHGFYYKPHVGIYLVGPYEELEKVKNTNGIENIDFSNYIKTSKDPIWLMDWSEKDNPKLMQYTARD